MRQKDSGKPEWESFAQEADAKKARGEKRPPAPTLTVGPRKRYPDAPPTGLHRPLAAAGDGGDELIPPKPELQMAPGAGTQPYNRFQLPLAQAPPAGMQPGIPLQASSRAMSPPNRTVRTQGAFPYPDRDMEAAAALVSQGQPIRISQKPPITGPEAAAGRPAWPTSAQDAAGQLSALRDRPPEMVRRERELEQMRQERAGPTRLKQEAEPPIDYTNKFRPSILEQNQPMPPRSMSGRAEAVPLARQPEPAIRQQQHSYPPPAPPPPIQVQQVRTMMGETMSSPQQMTPSERSVSQRALPVQDPFGREPAQPSPPAAAPSRAPESKRSNLMALLNDDPPPAAPPAKRLSDSIKPSPTPPPLQALNAQRPPPGPPISQRREPEPAGYPYSRTQTTQPGMPPLKPAGYSAQSPQPQQLAGPRSTLVSPVEAGALERDPFARHSYQSAHQSNSPQGHHQYGPPPTQQQQLHQQEQRMAYGSQSAYPYGAPVSQPQSSQAHAATGSPTPHYARHPADAGRPPPTRESWPTTHPLATSQQATTPLQQQQQQTAWSSQSKPSQSAWGAQHGAQPKLAQSSAPAPPSWAAAAPSSQPPHHLGLRDDRPGQAYAAERQPGLVQHAHHHSSHSLSGRYPPSDPRDARRPEPAPVAQQGYARYPSDSRAAAPPAQRDPRDPGPIRSFTPGMSGYGAHQPPERPPVHSLASYGDALRAAEQDRDAREREAREREAIQYARRGGDPRDLGRIDPRDPRAGELRGGDPRDMRAGDPRLDPRGVEGRDERERAAAALLGRQLRPHEGAAGGVQGGAGAGPGGVGGYDRERYR
jgi:hypothetical protein